MKVHICNFDVTGDIPKKKRTYEVIKARVVAAGRFSCFEASEDQQMAAIFTRLCRDPELEIIHEPEFCYPWVGVRERKS